MGELFADFEPYSVTETRKLARKEGSTELLITQVCKKLRKGKSPETIAEELEDDLAHIETICRIASEYAPDYPIDLILEKSHMQIIDSK